MGPHFNSGIRFTNKLLRGLFVLNFVISGKVTSLPKVIKYVKRSKYSFHNFSAKHTPSATLNRKGKQSIFTSIPLQWLCLFNEHETPSKFLYYVYAYNTFKYKDKLKENKINYWWKNLFNCSWMSWFWCFPECLRVHVKTGECCLFFQQISSLLMSIHIFMLGV